MKKFFALMSIIPILVLFSYIGTNAQSINEYVVNHSVETWQPITGTLIVTGDPDDQLSPQTNIGFDFPFDNSIMTNFRASTNGFIRFNSTYTSAYHNTTNLYNAICVLSMDARATSIAYLVQGQPGSRELIVQWNGIKHYSGGATNRGTIQLRIYEGGIVKIIYGPGISSLQSPGWVNYFGIYLSGVTNPAFVGVRLGTTHIYQYDRVAYRVGGNTYGPNNLPDACAYLPSGTTFTFSGYPQLQKSFPSTDVIYVLNNIYGIGHGQQPGVQLSNHVGTYGVNVFLKITGPVGSSNSRVVYRALASSNPTDSVVPVPTPLPNDGIYRFQHATGEAAGANGELNLTNPNLVGGLYLVEARMEIPAVGYVQELPPYEINFALGNDLEITAINQPRPNTRSKYPEGMRVPVIITYKNVGFNPVTSFRGNVKIYFENETTPVYDQSKTFVVDADNMPIQMGQGRDIEFDGYMPTRGLGNYRVVSTVELLDPAPDLDLRNNVYPRAGQGQYFFNIANALDLVAAGIKTPASTIPLGRPIVPIAQLKNYGVYDLSSPADAFFFVLNSAGDTVYQRHEQVETVPQVPYDAITEVAFNENLIIEESGTYTAYLIVTSFEDVVQTNNTISKQFNIAPGLSGTYTVGTANSGSSRNYATLPAALNDLYLYTMSGPVTLELTDLTYDIVATQPNIPALDLSSNIIGNSSARPLTIKLSPNISTNDIVNVNLVAANGVGILMGQNTYSSNSNAPVNNAYSNVKNRYSKANGYIVFDGGSNKNLQFTITSQNNFRTVFLLGQGASYNTIKNVRLRDGLNNPSPGLNLPTTSFNPANNIFSFGSNQNFTSGILMRSITPYDQQIFAKTNNLTNTYFIDTLVNKHNLIDNNIISGFTYGIASLGIGAIQKDIPIYSTNDEGEIDVSFQKVMQDYYNHNNTISNNLIQGSKVAGIMLGFEHNSIIKNNKIDTVSNNSNVKSYGILLGNEVVGNTLGYNNTQNQINGNEISNVRSNVSSTGIGIIQNRNAYTLPGMTELIVYPNVVDRNIVINNSIWNITSFNADANKTGISLMTGRSLNEPTSPAVAKYRTVGDVIANNTVIIPNDGLLSNGVTSAILLRQSKSTKVFNNALYIGDDTYGTGRGALLNVISQLPQSEGLLIDRNVYYTANSLNNDLALFRETNSSDVVFPETGILNEYKTLDQWQNWTSMDTYSYWYDFTGEILLNRNKLIINNVPDYPINSKLNNTGYKYNEIILDQNTLLSDIVSGTDISGTIRGVADSRYDIGSIEFVGRAFLRDFEVVKIVSPSSYKSFNGEFSDVNYVMTKAPVNVKALIRNNGNMVGTNILVKAVISREFADGNWDSVIVNPEYPTGGTISNSETYYTYVDVGSYTSAIADFNIGNPNLTPVFVPHTYYETRSYNVPSKFAEMATTVTPRYKIEVSIVDDLDQEISNNMTSNYYRFFIKKSNLDLMLSGENVNYDKSLSNISTDANYLDKLAGRLNYDSLKTSFNRLGWRQVIGIENPYYHFDVLDRKSWELRSIDYTLYNTLFWSDGDDKSLERTQEYDLRKFADNLNQESNWNYKKSLIVASQEFLRSNTARLNFLETYIKASPLSPNNPLGAGVSYDGMNLRGNSILMNYLIPVKKTLFSLTDGVDIFADQEPYPALMTLNYGGDGVTAPATYYRNRLAGLVDSSAGVTTFSLVRNVVYLGQDWRHFGNIDQVIRGINDFNAKHGSDITPVELVDFEAIDRNKNVELSWATASELNSKEFEIEKATLNESGKSSFVKIATEPASGKSNSIKTYGPIIDNDVNYGNTYVYRLRSIDLNGESSLSNEVEVSIDNFFGVSPNPASSKATYSFSIGDNKFATIELYNVAGQMVKSIFAGSAKSSDQISIDVNDLPNGTYTIVLKTDDKTYTTKLSVRK